MKINGGKTGKSDNKNVTRKYFREGNKVEISIVSGMYDKTMTFDTVREARLSWQRRRMKHVPIICKG